MNYYELLKVSPKASNAEIKSAYRKLARKLHPDKNDGCEEKSQEFALIAKAYEVLGNPKERAEYDRQALQAEFGPNVETDNSDENQYSRRWRRMAYERRYNEIIDRMIADERRESVALQKIIFPLVGLFVSTFVVAIFKPAFLTRSPILVQMIVVTLSIIGLIHLYSRLRDAFDRYTYDENIHDSILEDSVPEAKPYSRVAGIGFVVVGMALSLGAGLFIGNYCDIFIGQLMPSVYSHTFRLEFLFYPPIVVLCVDIMHSVVSKFD